MKTGIIILAHGSKRQETKETLAGIVELVKTQGGFTDIKEAYLQFNTPTLAETVESFVAQGIMKIVIAPYFLFKGVHNTEDIPNEIAELKEKHPGLEIVLAEPLGVDKRLAEILIDRIGEVSPWNI